ncbi:AlpA family phage regulatory protein [Ponticoccus alexandrii]|uniref:AlpA family phage regulatory protein n=1 Tax=Ponticoccus alexandrii TaxID=1943633 RepID=A0ABX7FES9_9RHOB|nr:AlpA family phage regulatory protein [Ponticoccus alexandrii]
MPVTQVAERFGVSEDTIWRWKRNGTFPVPRRLGPKMKRWRLADVLEFEAGLETCMMMTFDTSAITPSPETCRMIELHALRTPFGERYRYGIKEAAWLKLPTFLPSRITILFTGQP